MALYLVPASRENLERTIERDLPEAEAAGLVDPATLTLLRQRSGIEGLRCWAMTATNRGNRSPKALLSTFPMTQMPSG